MKIRRATGLITLCGAIACSAEPAGDSDRQDGVLGSVGQGLLGVDTHLYLLCNATGWTPSDATRLQGGATPGQFELTFEVEHSWMLDAGDYCQLAETNELNGWGTEQHSYDVRGVALSAPMTVPVGPGYQGVPLSYAQLGPHTVTYDRNQSTLSFVAGGTPPTGRLVLGGTSELTELTETHAQLFDGNFTLSNETGEPIQIERSLFFFAAPGGYAYQDPSTDLWWGPSIPAGATELPAGTFGWGWSAPVAHLVLRVDAATSSGARIADTTAVPVLAAGYQAPEASPYGSDVTIGVMGPLRRLFDITTRYAGYP